jgi:hypothetical protein
VDAGRQELQSNPGGHHHSDSTPTGGVDHNKVRDLQNVESKSEPSRREEEGKGKER